MRPLHLTALPLPPILPAALVTLALVFASRSAVANEGTTGYSGKPYNNVVATCKNCHVSAGAVPTLTITVPATMNAGDATEVTIVVNGTRTRTSMNAALSDGVTATQGQNTSIPFPIQTPGEVAAVAPPPNGAQGTYKFTFVAPQKNGPIMLWVAGMSASGNGTGGDGVTTATRTITITGAVTPPNDGGAPSDAGSTSSGSSGSSGSTSSGSTSSGSSSGTSGAGDTDAGSSSGKPGEGNQAGTSSSAGGPPSGEDPVGCSAARRGGSGAVMNGLASMGIAILALAARRRRRARS